MFYFLCSRKNREEKTGLHQYCIKDYIKHVKGHVEEWENGWVDITLGCGPDLRLLKQFSQEYTLDFSSAKQKFDAIVRLDFCF